MSKFIITREVRKLRHSPLWNMKQFGSSNHFIADSFLSYRGRIPKRALLVGSNEYTNFLFFTIS